MHDFTAGITCFLSTRCFEGWLPALPARLRKKRPTDRGNNQRGDFASWNAPASCDVAAIRPDTFSAYCAAQILGGFFIFGARRRAGVWFMSRIRFLLSVSVLAALAACASGPQPPAYPAFVISDELPDMFMASLPGIRAKQYAEDAQSRSTSNRIDLPADWKGTTGASPGKSLEIFVLSGELQLADLTLRRGGYAYIPPGSLGFNMQTTDGARILYFLADFDSRAMIRSPLVLDSDLIDWQPTVTPGVFEKELRADPGSGARTWLERAEPGVSMPWQTSTVAREGYLVAGSYQDAECVQGQPFVGIYASGGYFRRPAEAVSGGPDSRALTEVTWFFRERVAAELSDASCEPAAD